MPKTQTTTEPAVPQPKNGKANALQPKKERAREPYDPTIDLNCIQEHAIDLVVDLIVHGGAQDDVQAVATAALGHWYLRKFGDAFKSGKESEEHLNGFVWARYAEWEAALQAGRMRNPRREFEEEPNLDNTATGLIRAHARNGLIGEFEEFLVDGTPEEISLLREVLKNRDHLFGRANVSIAESFSIEIGKQDDYVKVRPDLTEKVRAYVAALEAIPWKSKVA